MPDTADAELLEIPFPFSFRVLNTGRAVLPLRWVEVRYAADRFQMVFDTRPSDLTVFGKGLTGILNAELFASLYATLVKRVVLACSTPTPLNGRHRR